jgi:hypothetical protein
VHPDPATFRRGSARARARSRSRASST